MIIKAAQFANLAHQGQVRKYTGRPYITHPARVASRVCLIPYATEEVVAAGWLHDVLEDCSVTYADLHCDISPVVASLVKTLTNPSKGSKLPRAARKAMDREHLANVSPWAKVIKLIDRIDNLREMTQAPDDFKKLYAKESLLLAEALCSAGRVSHHTFPILVSELKECVASLTK